MSKCNTSDVLCNRIVTLWEILVLKWTLTMPSTRHISRRSLLQLSAGGGFGLLYSPLSGFSAAPQAQMNEPVAEMALEPGWLLRWQDGKALLERDMHVLVRNGRIEAVQD